MAKWTKPEVELGQTVYWKARPTDPPIPSIVTAVGGRTVSLAIMHDGFHNFENRDGVRHETDPELRTTEMGAIGVWCHTPWTLRLQRLLAEFETPAAKETADADVKSGSPATADN